MENEKTILLKGSSNRSYVFIIYPWQTRLVCSGVVYVVLRRDQFGYSVLYVGNVELMIGHTTDLPLLDEFDIAGRTHIGIHIEPSVSMRQMKEKDLVIKFSPALNMR